MLLLKIKECIAFATLFMQRTQISVEYAHFCSSGRYTKELKIQNNKTNSKTLGFKGN